VDSRRFVSGRALPAFRAIPGRGMLNIPPDSGAVIWQKGCGAVIGFIREFHENS